ncbi:hypothetical protein BZA77DRAFT_288014 [Pyronema omphalodes]|nr:hypothetical protein BZA77DRAFT_288014 [Pyronema omphalodes]
MKFTVAAPAAICSLFLLFAPVLSSPPSPLPAPRVPESKEYDFYGRTPSLEPRDAVPEAVPQGVWEWTAPPGGLPGGCVNTVDFKFILQPSLTPPRAPVPVVCGGAGTMKSTLKAGRLTDSLGRIGSIVSNRQFQFDGPPAQAGAIYTAGWGICDDGALALGPSKVFWRCLSGHFYNLYDQNIAPQCEVIYLQVQRVVDTC